MATPHHVRRLTGGVLLLVAGLTLTVSLWPPAASAQYATVLVPGRGQVFCPQASLVLGSAVVPAGRCFKLAAYRDANGSYLAFLPSTAPIVPTQVASFNGAAPAGPYAPFLLFRRRDPGSAESPGVDYRRSSSPARVRSSSR